MPQSLATPTILPSRIRIPQHVVHRSLANETVMLNVLTGQYHSLNESGGRILDVLERTPDLDVAIAQLSEQLNVSEDVLRSDIARFCDDLVQRGLIELES
jgi:hypothetical protein